MGAQASQELQQQRHGDCHDYAGLVKLTVLASCRRDKVHINAHASWMQTAEASPEEKLSNQILELFEARTF